MQDMTPSDAAPSAPPPPAPVPSRRRRALLSLGLAACVLSALCASLFWLTATTEGFAWGVHQLLVRQGGQAGRVSGTLWQGFALQDVQLASAEGRTRIDTLRLRWDPSGLWSGALRVHSLRIGHVDYQPDPAAPPSPPPVLPATLRLPLDIRVDVLQVDSVRAGSFVLYGLQGRYRYAEGMHALEVERLALPWGTFDARLSLGDTAPFALKGNLGGRGNLEGVDVTAGLGLSGNLSILRAQGAVTGKALTLSVNGEFAPFAPRAYDRLRRIDARASGIDPSALLPGLPSARLNFAVWGEPGQGQRIRGGLSLVNTRPGPLGASRLPLDVLGLAFAVDDAGLTLTDGLATHEGARIDLSGHLRSRDVAVMARVHRLALRSLTPSAPAAVLDGVLRVDGTPSDPVLSASLGSDGLTLDARARMRPDRLTLERLSVQDGPGRLDSQGWLERRGARRFMLDGQARHLDPARRFPGLPAADLNATLKIDGSLQGKPRVRAALKFDPSRFAGAPLAGGFDVVAEDGRLPRLVADLRLADNRLQAQGSWGGRQDRLQLQVDAPALGMLGPAFGGSLQGRLQVSGSASAPDLSARLQAQRLRLPGGIAAQSLGLSGDVRADRTAPFRLMLDAEGVQLASTAVRSLHVRGEGNRARHRVDVSGNIASAGRSWGVQLRAGGGLMPDSLRWRGALERLDIEGAPALSLLDPLSVDASAARIELGSARMMLAGAAVSLEGFSRDAHGVVASRGRFTRLPLAGLLDDPVLAPLRALVFEGSWDVRTGAGGTGTVMVRRQSGDIQLPDNRVLGVHAAEASLQLAGGVLRSHVRVASALGEAEGTLGLPLNGGLPDAMTPLSGDVRVRVADLGSWARLSDGTLSLAGRLAADLHVSGPLGRPEARGTIDGQGLNLLDRRTGIRLADGVLAARLEGRRLWLDQLRFAGGKGTARASGALDLRDSGPDATVKVSLQQFGVFDRADRRLVVSGETTLAMTDRQIALTGGIRADLGRIDLPRQGAPALSDDVVILGRPAPEPSGLSRLPLLVDLSLDLGDNFRFSGQGLNVDLAGKVNLQARPGQAPAARGQVRVVKGRYKAYGQDLDIEQGLITFSGALDNPALNVRAVRRMSSVGAGVEVTGTVQSPRVKLVSNEAMSERDRLAWLVLGRAPTEGDDTSMAASAGTLLAGTINDQLGLFDDLGMQTRDKKTLANGHVNPAEQVVTVGKQLTREFYLGYEYGVTSANQAVKLMYHLSRGWSLVLRAGADASAETRYTLRFD